MSKTRSTRATFLVAFGLLIAACGSGVEQASLGDAELDPVTGEIISEDVCDDDGCRIENVESPTELETLPFDDSAVVGDAELDPVTGEIVSEDVCDDTNCQTEPVGTEPVETDGVESLEFLEETDPQISTEPLTVSVIDNDGELESELALLSESEVPAGVADCVRDEATSQGLEDLTDAAVVVAALTCDSNLREEARAGSIVSVERDSLVVTPDQVDCFVDGSIDWLASIPLTDTSVLDVPDVPDELFVVAASCGLSDEDAAILLAG